MKKTLLICGALLALTASLASAQGAGINLAWNDCYPAGIPLMTFACDRNDGAQTMYGSYIPPLGVVKLTGNEIVVDLRSASPVLPQWWMFKNAGTCRQTSLSANFNFVAGPYACVDYWAGRASGNIAAYQVGLGGPNRARIKLVAAIGSSTAGPVMPPAEYYSFGLVINNAKTVGDGYCDGCLEPVCIVLNSINLTQPPGFGNFFLFMPAPRNWVVWQNPLIGFCPDATPTRASTWGSMKALYR
jgi:hypothetical protein